MKARQLIAFARPYSGPLSILVLLTTASSILILAVPWLAGQMLARIVSGSASGQGQVIPLLLLCLAGVALLSFGTAYQSARTTAHLLSDLRQRVFDHVQRLPLGFHDGRSKGDTLALMTFEISRLSNFLTATLTTIPSRLLTTLGAIVLMFRIDARLALVVPVLVPAFYLILKIVGRRLRALGRAWQEAEAKVVAVAEEALEMLPATKAFTRERAQSERYQAALRRSAGLAVREGTIYAALEPLIGLLAAFAALAILLLAGHNVRTGQMSAAELFSFLFYAALLTRPVGALAHLYGQVQTARGTLTRLQGVLDIDAENLIDRQSPDWRARGNIVFEDVTFAYPGRETVLRGVNLDIAAGETVALLGANGAGKTAMINLLLRYYMPLSGRIFIDGQDSAGLTVADVRRQIGLVPQSAFLFNGTIRDNIAFGAETPTEERVDRAARLAQASKFIAGLPDGMDTLIGDRGLRLSGGQRQRIALARALINDPPILLFDEATSMFDEEGECAFIAACLDALKGRTVLLVTHRPATLALADRILTLDDGLLHETSRGPAKLNQALG
ncbi:ABC transporter ATP-binding protein [Sphingomonas hankyongi]|uniref:ABC transporter ATP-binding protein/permease n=1 Tax=Sphingomonas hankyongi TaxID=2908209 RepID=A0ABT0S308_9SPHN|nr:ABC transporter ATP-binding protein [Sphingomonas hankyongi]MCL6730136.1 ABC transporter ATP-binding protein/permease [Sphingomonas hankyongi]